jgi:hypothetical protein
MADIQEAAKWMRDGHEVRRRSWGQSPVRLHTCSPWETVRDDLDRAAEFTVIELLAGDWEFVTTAPAESAKEE